MEIPFFQLVPCETSQADRRLPANAGDATLKKSIELTAIPNSISFMFIRYHWGMRAVRF
jgi:hypothetical protein